MLKRAVSTLVITGFALGLSGCASWHNLTSKRRTEYLRSQTAAPLQVPAGLNAQGVGDDYMVPATTVAAPQKVIGILPPDSMADKLARGVIDKAALKKADDFATAKMAPEVSSAATRTTTTPSNLTLNANNTLALNQPIAQVWNSVGTALQHNGYKIALQDEKIASYYILDLPSTDQVITKATPIYWIKLNTDVSGNAYAEVKDINGNAVSPEIAQRILKDLSNGLAGKSTSSSNKIFSPLKRWFKEAF